MTARALGRDQLAAAALSGGPVRVVAGAGTGKTAVIAERFGRLVSSGVDPDSILVMTFTEKAAGEMRQRIEERIGRPAPAVGTFHSVALGWLRGEGRAIGLGPGFRILAGAERWILARELMWKLGDEPLTGDERPDDLVGPALQMLERMKQELVPLARLAAWAAAAQDAEKGAQQGALMRACVRLFRAYEKECRARRLLDFDDLLQLAVRLCESSPQVLGRLRSRHPYVLVDEYQDLNLAQERVVELMAQGAAPFVVGDDDQSIYRFRGASRASLERFVQSFAGSRTITLGLNRRSSRRIVAAASALIDRNPDRLPKRLASDRAGPHVQVWSSPDGESEFHSIAAEAERLIAGGVRPAGIAVLCRTNAIGRPVTAALSARRLPHEMVGGHGFYELAEIRDVVAMLRVLRDPADGIAVARVLSRPPAGLDQSSVLDRLHEIGERAPLEALEKWPPAAGLVALLWELSVAALAHDVRDVFFDLMERTRYLDALASRLDPADASRAAGSVGRFAELLAEFCETSSDHSLEAFMAHLDLVLLSGEDEEQPARDLEANAIQVMTIHQAKGLEFDAVFVPSLVEGRLPQTGRSPRFELPPAVLEPLVRGREDVIAEERRLLYVAMTRARSLLYLSWSARYDGARSWRRSRFLDEIDAAGSRAVRSLELTACPAPAQAPAPGPPAHSVQLSYSSMATYRECPRQYWYRYEKGLPTRQSAEAVNGVVLHEVLRRCGELRRAGARVGVAMLRRIHAEVWSATQFPDSRRAAVFARNGVAQLEAYLRRGGFVSPPVYVEQPFAMEMEGWSLRGVIDRVDRTDEGWRIVDYKSGRRPPRRRSDLQVALYALGANKALGLDPVELELVYLASGESAQVRGVDGLVDVASREGAEISDAIRAGRFEPQPERRRCRLCAYRLVCPAAL